MANNRIIELLEKYTPEGVAVGTIEDLELWHSVVTDEAPTVPNVIEGSNFLYCRRNAWRTSSSLCSGIRSILL